MKRRGLLAGVVASTVTVAGCLGDSDGDTDNSETRTNDESDDDTVEYEQCPHRIVRVTDLPSPAKEEALAAIENDGAEFDDGPYLPDVIDINEAYLLHEDRYYAVELPDLENGRSIYLTEMLPVFAERVILENRMDTDVTVSLRIEREGTSDPLLEETVELDADEHVTLNDDVGFPYGDYHAEFDGDDLSEQGTWEISWELDWAYETGDDYPIQLDDQGVFVDPVARNTSYGPCSWDEEGSVSSGDY